MNQKEEIGTVWGVDFVGKSRQENHALFPSKSLKRKKRFNEVILIFFYPA
jgi:hypothetical protein